MSFWIRSEDWKSKYGVGTCGMSDACFPDPSSGDIWVRVAKPESPSLAYFGRVADDRIVLVQGSPFGEWRENGERLLLDDIRLLPPIIPPTFYACGINYLGHARACSAEFNRSFESLMPVKPEVGYRAQSAIIAAGETIIIPSDAPANVQSEGELGVVIGRAARRVGASDALDYVLGYTVCNDVSMRDWQFADRTFWRSKNADTFKPLGPCIATSPNLGDMRTRISLNGEVQEEFSTANMLYNVAEYIEAISEYITLQPGDVIMMGTDGHSPRIAHGDTIEIAIDGVGRLINPVVRENAP